MCEARDGRLVHENRAMWEIGSGERGICVVFLGLHGALCDLDDLFTWSI